MHTTLGGTTAPTTINETVQANIRSVAFPSAPDTPGRPGDRAQTANYIAYYSGDGLNNHSWQFITAEPLTADFFS